MPNWCVNDLRVTGPAKDRERFAKEAADGETSPLDFNTAVPYPKEFRDLDQARKDWDEKERAKPQAEQDWRSMPKDGYNQGGYEWCIDSWGTKWNACDPFTDHTKSSLVYKFDTAWSPPIPVVKAWAEKYPTLTFSLRFWEGGMGFQGGLKVKGSDVMEEYEAEYRGRKGG